MKVWAPPGPSLHNISTPRLMFLHNASTAYIPYRVLPESPVRPVRTFCHRTRHQNTTCVTTPPTGHVIYVVMHASSIAALHTCTTLLSTCHVRSGWHRISLFNRGLDPLLLRAARSCAVTRVLRSQRWRFSYQERDPHNTLHLLSQPRSPHHPIAADFMSWSEDRSGSAGVSTSYHAFLARVSAES